MQKQKKGFWLFIFSLIPGAGEMYMGFKKQGISTMLLFGSIFAVGAGTGMDWLILFFPVVWFYSFFNVHNLKSLSEEEFYSIEDSYILHLDEFIGDADTVLRKHRKVIAIIMIVFGGSILWNNLVDSLRWILPARFGNFLSNVSYRLPQFIIAIAIILAGVYMLSDKRNKLTETREESKQEEHFWQPYRPYQQPAEPPKSDVADVDIIRAAAAPENTIEAAVDNTEKTEEK